MSTVAILVVIGSAGVGVAALVSVLAVWLDQRRR